MRIRAHLARMAVGILLPVVVLSAAALVLVLDAEREAAHRTVRETARRIAGAVDHEFTGADAVLRALAQSYSLASGDVERFREHAVAARSSDMSWIVLFDSDGQQLVNTFFPPGTKLGRAADPARLRQILASGRPSISNLYRGAMVKGYIITVDIPVEVGGKRYVLSETFFPEHFSRLIAEIGPPSDWLVAVNDANGLTLARSRSAAEFEGAPMSAEMLQAVRAANEGSLIHTSRDGIEIFTSFTHSKRTGWVVTAGVPTSILHAPARQAVLVAGVGVVVALLLAAMVAFVTGSRLSRFIVAAARSAIQLGGGRLPRPAPPSGIDEIERLQEALAEAGALLRNANDARARAEAERGRLLEGEHRGRVAAEEQNRTKDEFLAMLGHELRNPLSAISAAAAVLELNPSDQSARFARTIISRQTKHLSRVLDDLLDVSRVIAGKVMLERQPVDLADAAHRCVATLRAAGRCERHAVEVRAETAWVSADLTRLDQVITNLLANALKYTPAGGRIEVEVSSGHGEAVLSVSDTGVGIGESLLPRVFDVFVQGQTSIDRAEGGLGLGLALVRRLVALHGGTVTAASEGPGRGSTFVVRLPLAPAPGATLAGVQAARTAAPRRVLVIDDHKDSRDALRLMLTAVGHDVLEAADGMEGLRLAAEHRPEVAIVDIGLPGMDGYEVARRLRADPATRGMRLIALTGYGRGEDRRRALEAGFELHFVKPVDRERLAQALDAPEPV